MIVKPDFPRVSGGGEMCELCLGGPEEDPRPSPGREGLPDTAGRSG